MTSPLEKLLNTPIPSKLWHYTTMQGFKGIVESKNIWATDVRFTNDKTEFTHALQVANDIVKSTPEHSKMLFPARDYAKKAADIGFQNEFIELLQFFVASFSVAEDQLSQWRGYGGSGSGVSVAFDLSAVRPPAGLGKLVCLAPCVYKEEEKECLVNHCLNHFVETAQKHWSDTAMKLLSSYDLKAMQGNSKYAQEAAFKILNSGGAQNELAEAAVKTRIDLIRVAALCKHKGFYEEREWRLVLPIEKAKCDLKNPPQYRSVGGKQIPYIAWP